MIDLWKECSCCKHLILHKHLHNNIQNPWEIEYTGKLSSFFFFLKLSFTEDCVTLGKFLNLFKLYLIMRLRLFTSQCFCKVLKRWYNQGKSILPRLRYLKEKNIKNNSLRTCEVIELLRIWLWEKLSLRISGFTLWLLP